MGREYSIWNAAIALLQFWTADLDLVTLGRATEEVYSAFFYSSSSHTLCHQSDEILFGGFMIALNATFDQQLLLADKGYETSSDTINLPTPLRKCQESTMFPALNMLHSNQIQSHHKTHYKLYPDQCADDYHLVHEMMTSPQKSPHYS